MAFDEFCGFKKSNDENIEWVTSEEYSKNVDEYGWSTDQTTDDIFPCLDLESYSLATQHTIGHWYS